jgi:hypothetical protein
MKSILILAAVVSSLSCSAQSIGYQFPSIPDTTILKREFIDADDASFTQIKSHEVHTWELMEYDNEKKQLTISINSVDSKLNYEFERKILYAISKGLLAQLVEINSQNDTVRIQNFTYDKQHRLVATANHFNYYTRPYFEYLKYDGDCRLVAEKIKVIPYTSEEEKRVVDSIFTKYEYDQHERCISEVSSKFKVDDTANRQLTLDKITANYEGKNIQPSLQTSDFIKYTEDGKGKQTITYTLMQYNKAAKLISEETNRQYYDVVYNKSSRQHQQLPYGQISLACGSIQIDWVSNRKFWYNSSNLLKKVQITYHRGRVDEYRYLTHDDCQRILEIEGTFNDAYFKHITTYKPCITPPAPPAEPLDAEVIPTQFANTINLKINTSESDDVKVFVFDTKGTLVFQQKIPLVEQSKSTINLEHLPLGNYMVDVVDGGGRKKCVKVSKVAQ